MKTTLTLDDDVAALLEEVQANRKASLKEVVNTGLRSGLIATSRPPEWILHPSQGLKGRDAERRKVLHVARYQRQIVLDGGRGD